MKKFAFLTLKTDPESWLAVQDPERMDPQQYLDILLRVSVLDYGFGNSPTGIKVGISGYLYLKEHDFFISEYDTEVELIREHFEDVL